LRILGFFVDRLDGIRGERKSREVRILVAGCGSGNVAIPLAYLGYDVTGVDKDAAAIKRAKTAAEDFSLSLDFVVGTATDATGKFDAIILANALQNQNDPASFLESLKAKTKTEGILLVAADRAYGYSNRSLPRLLRATGWKPKTSVAISSWFKQFFHLLGRRFMKRGSGVFHDLDAIDDWCANLTPSSMADGWLMEARQYDQNKISVIQVVDSLNAGGAERLVLELAKRLPSEGFDVQVLALLRGGPMEPEFREAGIKSTVLGYSWPYGLDTLWKAFRFLRDERPEIVHTHLFAADVWGRLAAKFAGVPAIISTEHNLNQDFGWIRRTCKKLSNRLASREIAISQSVKTGMIEREGASQGKIILVPNGIDLERVVERPARHFRDVPRILTLSRLNKQKDLATLLKALALVKTSWILQIAGTGEEENELKALARRLNLESRVEFLGYRDNAPTLLSQADIFCLPSRWEGQGLAVLEAAAAGVPMVLSDLPVLRETLRENEASFVAAGDVPAWAQAINSMLVEPDAYVAKAQSAKARIREKFSIKSMVGSYAQVYREFAPGRSAEKPLVYQVVTSFYPAGAERLVLELAKRLPEHGYQTKTVAIGGGGALQDEFKRAGVDFLVWEKSSPFNIAALPKLYREFRKMRPLIVHTNLFGADLWGRSAAWLARVPLIVTTEHNAYLDHGAIKRWVKRRLAVVTDGCVAVSDMVRNHMTDVERMPEKKITVIKNAVDVKSFGRRSGEGSHDPVRLINVGRLTRQKDQATLLKALAGITRPWNLRLVGTGELQAELQSLAEELGIADRVEFLGHRHDIGRLLAESDLFVSTSRWEGLALTVIEAAATGVPMVLPDILASHEIAEDGEARFAEPGDIEAFREAIEISIRDYPMLLEHASQTAERVKRDFAIERLVDDYAKYYRNLELLHL